MNFKDFDLLPQSVKALAEQGIHEPTPIQEQAIPFLLDSIDVIGQARTGSGKTLAFSLPMLEFVDPREKKIQGLVVTPTRELANQITEVIDGIGKRDGIKVLPVFGGRSINPMIAALKRGVHILVATPGRLVDLIGRRAVNLDHVNFAVVDEADEMLDSGFAKDVEKILKNLRGEHVTALFSATMPDWVHEASRKYLYKPEVVKIEPEAKDEPKIEHKILKFPEDRRLDALQSLLEQSGEGTSIVFGRTKHGVKKLTKKLDNLGYSVACLQGNMSQNARDRVMESFRKEEFAVLVATNVAARGLDVDHVELVVNYELPENAELLTHRVGRTGRMGREGQAYTMVADSDLKKWNKLKRDFKRPMTTVTWSGGEGRKSSSSGGDSRRSQRSNSNGNGNRGRNSSGDQSGVKRRRRRTRRA